MTNTITQLIKSMPVLTPDDSVRRAAGIIRASDGSDALVALGPNILGTVSEKAITEYIAQADDPRRAAQSPVGPLVSQSPVLMNSNVTLQDATRIFASSGMDMLPVIDDYGVFRGVLYRRDVVGVLTNNFRPPSVGGMATPLGVYLTTGSHTGGAGSFGLFLTGAALMLMMVVSRIIVEGLPRLYAAITGSSIIAFLDSPPITLKPNIYDLAYYLSTAGTVILYFIILRLSPLAGYHAAEHMTVHAMEAGEELTPERVRPMPRVHPRCGTNLLAAAGVFLIITSRLNDQFAVLMALVVVVLGWRSIGGWLQYRVTTKPPSEKQLKNGVAAGNELLAKFQEQPNRQLFGFDRIWRLGFIQTFIGGSSVILLMTVLDKLVHLPAWLFSF